MLRAITENGDEPTPSQIPDVTGRTTVESRVDALRFESGTRSMYRPDCHEGFVGDGEGPSLDRPRKPGRRGSDLPHRPIGSLHQFDWF